MEKVWIKQRGGLCFVQNTFCRFNVLTVNRGGAHLDAPPSEFSDILVPKRLSATAKAAQILTQCLL